MIRVCSVKKGMKSVGECWSFPNGRLNGALAFARIGSQHGRVRRVHLCGRLVRVYSNGLKVAGGKSIAEIRRRARACA